MIADCGCYDQNKLRTTCMYTWSKRGIIFSRLTQADFYQPKFVHGCYSVYGWALYNLWSIPKNRIWKLRKPRASFSQWKKTKTNHTFWKTVAYIKCRIQWCRPVNAYVLCHQQLCSYKKKGEERNTSSLISFTGIIHRPWR